MGDSAGQKSLKQKACLSMANSYMKPMSTQDSTKKCAACGKLFPLEHEGPCTTCGGEKINTILAFETAVMDWRPVDFSPKSIREYYEEHPIWSSMQVMLTFFPPILGFWFAGPIGVGIGLVFAVLSHLIGYKATIKIREIQEGGRE